MKLKDRQAKLIAMKFDKEPAQKVTSDEQPPPLPLSVLIEITKKIDLKEKKDEEWLEEKDDHFLPVSEVQ